MNWTTVNCPRGGDEKQCQIPTWGVGHEIDKCIRESVLTLKICKCARHAGSLEPSCFITGGHILTYSTITCTDVAFMAIFAQKFYHILLQCVDLKATYKQWDYTFVNLKKGISQSSSH